MKKLISLLLVLLLLCPAVLAEDTLFGVIEPDVNYKITLTRKAVLKGGDTFKTMNYHVQQGSATDGTYAYFVLEDQHQSLGSIWKVDMSTWKVVDTMYDLPIDHGNDMTYNPGKHQLVVVNNKPHYNTLTFIDPDTLTIIETKKLTADMYAIAYNPASDRYVIGLSGSWNFMITDGEFNVQHLCIGKDTGLVKQGVECDDSYIYFPQCKSDNSINQLVVYDWEGNYVNTIRVSAYQEIESLFHNENGTYIAFNASGSSIYEAKLNIIE
ncbi:MAG: hypothetical protein MJ136_02265 [Clostridia bacterium]|nr:hypothetical protein [Clostridia bacterium]